MKKLIFTAAIGLLLVSCRQERYEGYIVYKGHIPKHMCCSDPKSKSDNRVIPPNEHTHVEQEQKFILHIGNKYGTVLENVTEDCYRRFDVLDKVKVEGESIELIKKGCR